ncbi:MAG: hypothetical protein ABIB04_01500 [Patescibacteria group bacterium]
MPGNEENEEVIPASATKPQSSQQGITDEVAMHVMRIFGNQNQYEPTQAQVDKILSLQEKGMDYTHEERTRVSPKQKLEVTVLIVGAILLLIVFILCLFSAKEYLGEVVSGIVGLLAGSFGGYGFGKSKTKKDE